MAVRQVLELLDNPPRDAFMRDMTLQPRARDPDAADTAAATAAGDTTAMEKVPYVSSQLFINDTMRAAGPYTAPLLNLSSLVTVLPALNPPNSSHNKCSC